VREAGVVLDLGGNPLYWHAPQDRSGAYLPDTRDLWCVIWENRDNLSGIAHTHPGSGIPGPSMEDLTTFAAVESGLGQRLVWWIATSDHLRAFTWVGPDRLDYQVLCDGSSPNWVDQLRELSV
jgi:hypothetical protein